MGPIDPIGSDEGPMRVNALLGSLLGERYWLVSYVLLGLGLVAPGEGETYRAAIVPALVAILFLTGLRVPWQALLLGLRQWHGFARLALLVALKLVVLPGCVLAVGGALGSPWTLGLFAIVAMPAGFSSAAFADLKRGNVTLAFSVVTLTALLAPASVPLLVAGASELLGYVAPDEVAAAEGALNGSSSIGPQLDEERKDASGKRREKGHRLAARRSPGVSKRWSGFALAQLGERARFIAALLFGPFALSQLVRWLAPRWVVRHQARFSPLALVCLGLVNFAATAATRELWWSQTLASVLSALLGVSLATALAFGVGYALGYVLPRADAIAATCNLVYVNNGLGVAFALAFFPGEPRVALPAVVMGVPMLRFITWVGRGWRSQPAIRWGAR